MHERAQGVAGLAKELGARRVDVDEAAPVVFARLRARAVSELAKREEVAGIFLYDPEGIEDLEDSIGIANSDDVHALGPRGAGVRVAVWEDGPDDTSDLVIQDRYTSSPSTSDHSRHVHGIIRNDEAGEPHGHAPDCTLYSANSKDLAALRWAVKDRGCTVVNQSFHRSSEPESGSLSFDDVYKDWLALQWPYPTIVQAAGNYWNGDPDDIDPPSSEFVNHKGYNSLAVGNHDDSASSMSSSSVFRNPTSSHGDRELPEIAANGTGVEAVDLTKSGTSMASPAVAGVTALLQSASSTLKSWPEGCRAVLLAGSTRNV
ncbi:MAG TPA: S8/S53 family peptidase, partial [Gaiellaceae bacterium]|nr:S8/S53 family peptidase [Gaiellaceae bacterium]